MGRMIDEDVVLQRFIQESEYSGVNVVHINTIKRILQDIDTAYDVEKVVEQLEMCLERCENVSYGYAVGKTYAYKNAIAIIRKGGVE